MRIIRTAALLTLWALMLPGCKARHVPPADAQKPSLMPYKTYSYGFKGIRITSTKSNLQIEIKGIDIFKIQLIALYYNGKKYTPDTYKKDGYSNLRKVIFRIPHPPGKKNGERFVEITYRNGESAKISFNDLRTIITER